MKQEDVFHRRSFPGFTSEPYAVFLMRVIGSFLSASTAFGLVVDSAISGAGFREVLLASGFGVFGVVVFLTGCVTSEMWARRASKDWSVEPTRHIATFAVLLVASLIVMLVIVYEVTVLA